MGSSKKHKRDKDKESRKRKHRSESQSPLTLSPEKEKPRRHHKKHKKRERSYDVEEVPVDSHLYARGRHSDAAIEPPPTPSPPSTSSHSHSQPRYTEAACERPPTPPPPIISNHGHSRSRYKDAAYERHSTPPPPAISSHGHSRSRHSEAAIEKSPTPPPSFASHGDSGSLSIEETNRLRAKLGLKPLQLTDERDSDDGKIKDDLGEFYHKPAINISEKKKSDKIQAKLTERKEKRKIEERLLSGVRGLGSDSEDEGAAAWVKKNRHLNAQKQEAAKRAAMLDELDAEFGIGALVGEEERAEKTFRYHSKHLAGLRVAHDIDEISEGSEVVLTLEDKDVLAENNEDVLVNVNILDNERYKKSNENKRVGRLGYQAYTEDGDAGSSGMLTKYDSDDEKQKGFIIGDEDGLEAAKFRKMMVKKKLTSGKQLVSLNGPGLQVASDYLTPNEMTKFKKIKKKGRPRNRPKLEPIDVDEYDGHIPLNTDDTDMKYDPNKIEPDDFDEEMDKDTELEAALARARRLRLAEQQPITTKVEKILSDVKMEIKTEEEEPIGGVVLDSTAEFCRTLGDIPTYGLAGNRDQQDEIIDFDMDQDLDDNQSGSKKNRSNGWNAVDTNTEIVPEVVAGGSVLEAEPSLGTGVAGALHLAMSKGYLAPTLGTRTAPPATPRHAHLIRAANYSIDDKAAAAAADADERRRDHHRDRHDRYSGSLQEFREKTNFKPDVKLDYVDDEGRPLEPKEAFRYLSHKFHGKGPGKNKKEKRIKKATQEGLMKQMSSTDTPLGTLALLRQRQEETRSPFVLLSGHKKMT